MNEGFCKKRAVLLDFTLLMDGANKPNYFILKLCDNLEVSEYSDLIVLAADPQQARQWLDQWCVGDRNLVYKTEYDLADDIKHIKSSHKSIGAIVGGRFSVEGVNQRLVPILRPVGKAKEDGSDRAHE